MNVTKEEIKQFLKDSIEWLVDEDMGCCTLPIDDKLAICVGWLSGYDANDSDVIHSKDDPTWAITAGLKVYTSDDMRTDYEFINSPYYDNGEVVSTDVSLEPDANLDELADYFIEEYENLENLEIEEDGRIIEDNFDDSYEDSEVEEESLKEAMKTMELPTEITIRNVDIENIDDIDEFIANKLDKLTKVGYEGFEHKIKDKDIYVYNIMWDVDVGKINTSVLNEGLDEVDRIIGWISDHDDLYDDFKEFFDYSYDESTGEEIGKPSKESIIDWLSKYGQAYKDFKKFFKITDESLKEEKEYYVGWSKMTLNDIKNKFKGYTIKTNTPPSNDYELVPPHEEGEHYTGFGFKDKELVDLLGGVGAVVGESLKEDVELFKKYGANPSKSSRGWDAGDLHKYEDGLVLSYSSKKDAEEAANKLKQDGFKISSIDNDNIQSNGKGLEWNIYCFKESLNEESNNKGNRIANTVAKFFKGQSGPMGDDDPSVSGNTLEFWTQAGTSTYTFSDDGSIYAESDYDAETAYNDGGGWEGFYDEDDLDVDADDYEDEDEYLDALNDAGLEKFVRENGDDYEPKTYKSIEELCNSEDGWFSGLSKSQATSLIKKVNSILNSQEESCKKQVKESWEGESIIDDLIERAQSMYDEGGYGDIDECVAQAIDEGLIYSDDILELAKHYGTLPDDSDLIAEFYDELSSDVYSGIEEHEESDEDEFEDDEETDESLDESKVDVAKCKDILNNQIDWTEVDEYGDVDYARDQLRSLHSENVISDDEYNYIVIHWDELLDL